MSSLLTPRNLILSGLTASCIGCGYYHYKLQKDNFFRDLVFILEADEVETLHSWSFTFKKECLLLSLDEDGNTPIHKAAMSGSVECMKYILSLLDDPLVKNSWKCSIIHIACQFGQNEIFFLVKDDLEKRGLDFGVILETQPLVATKMNLFQLATFGNSFEIFEALCDAKNNLDEIDFNYQDQKGLTCLHLAVYAENENLIQFLLNTNNIDVNLKETKSKTVFHFAVWMKNLNILKMLLTKLDEESNILNEKDPAGKTCLHLACVRDVPEIVELLIQHKADVNAQERDRSTPLLSCINPGCVQILMENNADLLALDAFGSTPLHKAITNGRKDLALCLANYGGNHLNAVDNDGYRPLDTLVCTAYNPHKRDSLQVEEWVEIGTSLIENDADVCAQDYGGETVIHKIMKCPNETNGALLSFFLSVGGMKLAEMKDIDGCSGLNFANKETKKLGLDDIIRSYCSTSFLESFTKIPERLSGESKATQMYLLKRGAHARIAEEEREAVLGGEHNLLGFTNALKTKLFYDKDCKIVLMVGAGISVNSGIPDFRSKKGIYSKFDSNIFSMDGVVNHTETFYEIVRQCFLPVKQGKFSPTATHYFFKLLHDKGLLHRLYTQNIDSLEDMAGVPREKIVKAHGDHDESYCAVCGKPFDNDQFWKIVEEGKIPKCMNCQGVVRPAVTFFGEPLSSEFFQKSSSDFGEADFLIIMGTTLLVYPFAGLTNQVKDMVPRLLINKEATGPFKNMPEPNAKDSGARFRDAVHLGDCDEAVIEFANLMGWKEDLNTLIAKGGCKN